MGRATTKAKGRPTTKSKKKRMHGFSKRAGRKNGTLLTSSTPGRVLGGYKESKKGEQKLSEKTIIGMISTLSSMIASMTNTQLLELWNREDMEKMLAGSVDSFAAKAVEDTFGLVLAPDGMYCTTRPRRMAAALVGQHLRGAKHIKSVIEGQIRVNKKEVEFGSPDIAGTYTEKRNTRRYMSAYERKTGNPVQSFFDLQPTPPPYITPTIPLSAVDGQIATWLPLSSSNSKTHLKLRISLPTKAKPQENDWVWCVLNIGINPEIFAKYLAGNILLTLPTLRVVKNQVRADITVDKVIAKSKTQAEQDKEKERQAGAYRVFGFDWGVGKLLTGSVVTAYQDGTITTNGKVVSFNAAAWHQDDHSRRIQAEKLRTQAVRAENLASNCVDLARKAQHLARASKYRQDAANVDTARRNANLELARIAALWAVNLAIAAGAHLISIENLDSMEPKFDKKRRVNLSSRIRGMLRDALRQACKNAGIGFIEIDPANTSACCAICGNWVKHIKAPDNKTKGWHWAWCDVCVVGMDRDHNASINIAVRAIRNPKSGQAVKQGGHTKGTGNKDFGKVLKVRPDKVLPAPKARTSLVHNPQADLVKQVKLQQQEATSGISQPIQPKGTSQKNCFTKER